jgi:hypothetical protein
VDADEGALELLLEAGERLLHQEFARGGAHRHVLELGAQVEDLGQRHEVDLAALVDRKVPARLVGRGVQRLA